ncbi:MAG TPA: extracellular solute-binding protein [Chloroflexota bacterium]|jgi:multiple sugar transport system substrate-binding protein|nr:extracellular solute-binding protein [Chloroflexota bacterium]
MASGVLGKKLTRARLWRTALAGAAGTVGAAVLQACQTRPGGEGGAAPSKRPVKLTFEWPTYTPPKQEWAEYAMKTYAEKFPHVSFEPMWNTNPTEKLTTTLAGGQPPDVGWFGVGHWQFYQAFKPVEPLMAARKLKVEDYFPTVVEAMKWRGKMYAFPMGINTSAMFVNKGIYERAGVPLPTDEQTWDDLVNTGKRLTSGDGAQKVWANNAQYYTPTWSVAYGGSWLDPDGTKVTLNNPRTLKVLTLWRELWEKHGASPNPAEYAEATTASGGQPYSLFTGSRLAQMAAGTWGLPPARKEGFDWDLAEVPALVDGGRRYKGAFAGTEEIFVVAGTPNEDPAADFAAWLCGPEHLTWTGNRGDIIPAHQKTAREAFVLTGSETRPKNLQAFVRAVEYAPPIAPHPLSTTLQRAYATSVAKWLGSAADPTNTLTAEQALKEAETEMQRLLDEWNREHPR